MESLLNFVHGDFQPAKSGETFEKRSPVTGALIFKGARSSAVDIDGAVASARRAQPGWSDTPAVKRGEVLHALCNAMDRSRQAIAERVALETGKSRKDAGGEVDGAIALGRFFAGEGQRLYGRTTTSGTPHRQVMTVRQPCGVAGLIIAANTPIANVAWKVFPALICGNSAVLKAAEDTPGTAALFAGLAAEAGVPPGVLNVVQGIGAEAGSALVAHPEVNVVSFTGSTKVGREIAQVCARSLKKVSLELGGKNAFVVCDDADLTNAVKWAALSAFSNAGQRCAAASRIIVFDAVYDRFRQQLLEKVSTLKVGPTDDDDFGPVINARQLSNLLAAIDRARTDGGRILCGGHQLVEQQRGKGFFLAPTLIEGLAATAEASTTELFGPLACLYRVKGYAEALALTNDSPYGLTACIHTRNVNRALDFARRVQSGVAVVNAGTFGSEPHMPFGGVKQSGNGTREPGTEALEIYSDLKDVYVNVDPGAV